MQRNEFLAALGDALRHIEDHAWLAHSPLVRLVPEGEQNPGEQLSKVLISAIRQLRPQGSDQKGSPKWRQYRHLLLRYLLGATPQQIAQELNVSNRQARRDHLDALEALGNLLWRDYQLRLGQGASATDSEDAWLSTGADVQAEIVRLGETHPTGPTMVEETVRGVLRTVANLAASRRITFDVQLTANSRFVATDRTIFRQILLNLLSLLIESHQETYIHLSDGGNDERVEIRLVVDCQRNRGFARTEVCSPVSRDFEDSRLAICRQLLATQGGTLHLHDATNGNHGISLTLPSLWTATVLVIDDNPDFVRLFQRYLGDRTYRIHHASTAEMALRFAQEIRPDVITLDVVMPTQDGWEILQALKTLPSTRDIPVIVCSVLHEDALARSLGAAACLTKPVKQSTLLAAIERFCAPQAVAEHRGSPSGIESSRQRRALSSW